MEPSIIVALIAGAFGFSTAAFTVGIQVWTQRQNRSDHGDVMAEVILLKEAVQDSKLTALDTNIKVSEVKQTQVEHHDRLLVLEQRGSAA